MSLSVLYSRAEIGLDAPCVTVEVHITGGLPRFSIVGLPEVAVRESKDRVRSAIMNSRFQFPDKRITVNLAPADLPKDGGRFDLPIALGILAATDQLPPERLPGHEFIGELALTGKLRGVRGALPAALKTKDAARHLVLPRANAAEASLVADATVLPADHILDVHSHLAGCEALSRHVPQPPAQEQTPYADLRDVHGQHLARRALEITAAGGHNLLLIGPPGTGKTMLATRLPGIMPQMSEEEALQTASLRSISQRRFSPAEWRRRPFRAPHHTASGVALVGGGGHPRPGEISLAHNGILFLDELPEFDRRVLEVLREPMESGQISISRAARQVQFPARFQLVAAMNPCPCGWLGDSSGRCHCSAEQVQRYRARVSGPLLDRIDLHVEVAPLPATELHAGPAPGAEKSDTVRRRVIAAMDCQRERCGRLNRELSAEDMARHCSLACRDRTFLTSTVQRLGMSARAFHRIIKVARTIADLAGETSIRAAHLAEAIGYRSLDRARG